MSEYLQKSNIWRLRSLIFGVIAFFSFFSFFVLSQTVTIANLSTGIASSPLIANTTSNGVFGFSLTASTGTQSVTAINVQVTSTVVSKWGNFSLITSTDNSYATTGDNSAPIAGLTFDASSGTQIAITGLSESITTTTKNYFLVVDINSAVTGATAAVKPSLGASNVTSSATMAGSATGTNFSFTAPTITIANLSTGLAASPLVAASTGQGVFGFSFTSNSTQSVTAVDILVSSTAVSKWTNYSLVASTDNSFSTTGDNSTIGGLTFDASSGTKIAVTGLSQSITSTTKNYFLVVDVNPTVNASTTAVQPSLGSANVTSNIGGATGTATGTSYSFAPLLTLSYLSTGLASSPLIAGSSSKAVFGFSLVSSGSQTVSVVNIQLSSTPSSKWSNYSLVSSTDASYSTSGDNSTIAGLTFTPSSSQVAITGLSESITTTSKNYFLVVNVGPSVTSGTTAVQPTLVAANITSTPTAITGSATGTSYSFDVPTASFTVINGGTAPVVSSTVLSAGTTTKVLTGFEITTDGSQVVSSIDFNYSGLTSQFTTEYLYGSSTAGSLGTLLGTDNSPDGSFSLASVVTDSTPLYFYLVVDVANSVTNATASVTTAPTQANVTFATGNKNPLSISRTFTFSGSQLSDIIYNSGGTSFNLAIGYSTYRTIQYSTINDTDLTKSRRIGNFTLRDGGASAPDPDNLPTNVTSITISVTGYANIKMISLFNDDTDVEIAGTEQAMSGTGIVTFNPSSPIVAGDDGEINLDVRVTFQATVTDNDKIDVSITGATSNNSGSQIAGSGACASTSPSNPLQKIDVQATNFIFSPASPPSTSINTPFSLTVKAVDNASPTPNIDLDYSSQLDLTASGISGASGTLSGTNLSPFLTAGQFAWSDLKISGAGSYTLKASDFVYDNLMADGTATISISSSPSTITGAGTTSTLALCYGSSFQTLGNIVITEADATGFSTGAGVTFSLTLPSGFVFDVTNISIGPTVGGGSDISVPSNYSYPSNNVAQFSYTVSGTSNVNSITITGLKVGSPHPGTVSPSAIGPLNITRSGGSAVIAGIVAGTDLKAKLTASQASGTADFSVIKINSGDPDVAPNTTSFNVNGNAVNMVGVFNSSNVTGVFTGSGITFVNPNYRFTPGSLSPGTYPITFTYTDAGGCQYVQKKNFEVFSSGINGLAPSYCSNENASGTLDASPTYINQVMAWNPGSWTFDQIVYYDPSIGWVAMPANTFDPKSPIYQNTLNYFGGQIPVGFSVYGTGLYGTVAQGSLYVVTYQWVTVKVAPTPTFTLPRTAFCADDLPVTLTGTPANSNNTTNDKFSATGGQGASLSGTGTPVVWSFNPQSVTGVSLGSPVSFDLTYTYLDPATGCSGTSAPTTITVNARPSSVIAANILSVVSQQICQGAAVPNIVAKTLPSVTYKWYSDTPPTNLLQTNDTFSPPVDNTIAQANNYYVTQTRGGCESDKQPTSPTPPLMVSIIVNPTPVAPTVANSLPTIQSFCINTTVPNQLVTGATLPKWYDGNGVFKIQSATPTAAQLGINNATSGSYSFYVTDTQSGCEGFIPGRATKVAVDILALPNLSISSSTDTLAICTTGAPIIFTGFDNGVQTSSGTWNVSGTGIPGGSLISNSPTAGQSTLTTTNFNPRSDYKLSYSYTNVSGCSNSIVTGIHVFPTVTPAININQADLCLGLVTKVNNNSTVSNQVPSGNTASIVSTTWDFSDGTCKVSTAGTTQVQHKYNFTGAFNLSYSMITTDGCNYSASQQITINPKPNIDFSWGKVCRDTATLVSQTKFIATESSTPTVQIQDYNWKYNVSGALTYSGTPSSGAAPTVNYNKDGKDTVQLIVTSFAQCKDTVSKVVFVVPSFGSIYSKNNGSFVKSYSENFNNGSVFHWIPGGLNSSWAWGTPAGNIFIGDSSPSGTGQAWDTNLTGDSNPSEKSWVLSGCHNFDQSTRPVISLDIWAQMPQGVDGAVLQYNTNGNIEDDASWTVLGSVGNGINWYDEQGIANNPGNQASGALGWTGNALTSGGKYSNWSAAIYKLDELIGKKDVVFRVAFASGPGRSEGFTFDNVFIGERSRNVLIENFTNSSTDTQNFNDNFINFGNGSEVVKVQYHTPFPGQDPINDLNIAMNNSRTSFYGITSAPTLRVDGNVANNLAALKNEYDNRVLIPALLRIDVSTRRVKGAIDSVVMINTIVTNTSNSTLPTKGTHVFTTIVQKTINDASWLGSSGNAFFRYVAREMLPTAAGILVNKDLSPGDTIQVPGIIWDGRSNIPKDSAAIVVYVQSVEANDKIVQQAYVRQFPTMPDNIVTAVENISDLVFVYPNPSDKEFNVELPQPVKQRTSIALIDQLCRSTNAGAFNEGEQSKAISTLGLAEGLYILQVGDGGNSARKKVLIIHK